MELYIDQVKTFGIREDGETESDVDARFNQWSMQNWDVTIIDTGDFTLD